MNKQDLVRDAYPNHRRISTDGVTVTVYANNKTQTGNSGLFMETLIPEETNTRVTVSRLDWS